ncbi:MAG: hypothetical protein GEU28_01130 [Dehalococcoidia bacterium]|nr:hypothetical protein [Dehalococcoidia bacterium]
MAASLEPAVPVPAGLARVVILAEAREGYEVLQYGTGVVVEWPFVVAASTLVDPDLYEAAVTAIVVQPEQPGDRAYFADLAASDHSAGVSILRLTSRDDGDALEDSDRVEPAATAESSPAGGEGLVVLRHGPLDGTLVAPVRAIAEHTGSTALTTLSGLAGVGDGVAYSRAHFVGPLSDAGGGRSAVVTPDGWRPLLDAAREMPGGLTCANCGATPAASPSETPVLEAVDPRFFNFVFTSGLTGDPDGGGGPVPVDDVQSVPFGQAEFFVFFSFEGMANGVTWGWSCLHVDGRDFGSVDPAFRRWDFGESGRVFTACATEDGAPLPRGDYRITIVLVSDGVEATVAEASVAVS